MKASFLLSSTLLAAAAAFAQTGAMSGKIVTASGGNPVPKAAILVKNTATDASFSTQSAANDTVGLTDRGWIAFGSYPQTEKLHIIERFRRPDLGHLSARSRSTMRVRSISHGL